MAKSAPRRSLKSLFSKKEVNHEESVEKSVDKNEAPKKRFQFLKFKTKPKTDPGPVKPVHESQQLLSAAEPSKSSDDGGTWVNNVASDNKRFSLFGTSPRSKPSILPSSSEAKELSYSELDLRKPKRVSSFTFNLRKKKKNDDEENISKSSTGLNSPSTVELKEPPPRLSLMKLDETDTKTTFTMSQPELKTSNKFDIPSPPPVATNQSESHFITSKQSESNVDINIQPEAKEALTNGSDLLDIREELQKAPIATIPELQLDNLDSSEEKQNIAVYDSSNPSDPTTLTDIACAVSNQSEPILPASQPPILLDTSDDKVAVADSVSPSSGPCDNDILQQSHKTTEISLTETNRDTLSYHQPDAPDTADSTAQNVELSLASVDSKIDITIMESTPVPHADNSTLNADSASVHQEISIPRIEGSTPETAMSVTATSTVSEEKSTHPVSQTAVYGELYDSLLPQKFTSEVVSSISNPPPQIRTETRHLSTRNEPIMVKTLNELHTETNVIYSRLPASRELYSSPVKKNTDATFSKRKVIPATSRFMFNETSTAFQPQRNTDIYSRYLTSPLNSSYKPTDSGNIPRSTLTHSLSEVKSDSVSLIQDNVSSVSVVQSPAPPASYAVTSQEADTQVTDSKRRAILIKELVTEEVSADPVCLSPAPVEMSATEDLKIKIETKESFSAPSGQTYGSDRPLSPAYLSVGSDDGSATEIYYSAEEDNTEEVYKVDERKESHVVDVVKEAGLHEEIPQQELIAESGIKKREEGEFRVVIVKTQSEEDLIGNEQEKVDLNSRTEVQQQVRGQRSEDKVHTIVTSRFLFGNDAWSQEKEVPATVLPQVKEESKEERREKLLTTLDNAEESKDVEVYKVDERQETRVADVVKEAGLREEIPQQEKITESGIKKTEEGEFRVVIVKTQSEEDLIGNEQEKVDLNSRTEVQQQVRGQRSEDKVHTIVTSRFLFGNDAWSQEKEVPATVLPQVKEESKEERREKLLTTLDNAEESKDVEVYKVDERQETRVADVVKEAGLREEIPQQEKITESGIKKTEEGEFRVVIVKTQSEEDLIGNEQEKVDLNSRTEVQQQVRDQRSEDKVHMTVTSRFLYSNDAWSQEKEVPATALPQVKEESKEERREKLLTTLDNAEESKDVEVYKVDERQETRVADVVKEAGLREEIPQQEKITESGIKKTEEGEYRVVIVKTQSEEDIIGNEQEKVDLNSRTEVQQQVRDQRSEDKVHTTVTSRFLYSNDAWSQEKEVPATALPQVKEVREEEKKEKLPAKLDNAEESKNVEVYKVDERKEGHTVDVVKESGLREEIPQQEEIAESRIKKTEEGEFRVVIVKTQSEEDIIGNEQEKVDLNSRTEVQQQVRDQRSEDKVHTTVTSRFLYSNDLWSQEKEVPATALPQVKEVREEEKKETLPATLDKAEKSKDVEVYKVDERKETRVADVVKEAGLREEIPQQEKITESGIKKTEDKVHTTVTSRFLYSNDAWSQEKEAPATVLPQVKEVREEEKKEKLPAKLDNAKESKDVEVYKVDERKESHTVDVVKEAGLREETPQQEKITESTIKKTEDKVHTIVTSRFLVDYDAKSQEKEVPATVLPQVKEVREEEKKEKLPAKLDNAEESKDVKVYKVDERKESCVADVVKEAGLREEISQQEKIAESRIKKTEDKVHTIVTSRFLYSNDAWSQEKEVPATVLPQGKEESKEERREKLPATLDNAKESKDVKVYKVDDRKESCVADVVKEAGLREEIPQQEKIAESRIKRTEDKVHKIVTSRFLVDYDAKSQEKDVAATVLPQVKEETKEEKKEELPATPVQQVNTVKVCDFAPPSSEPHGQGEGSKRNWTAELETEDPPNGEKQLPSQKIQYLSHKDTVISEYMHAPSSNTREDNVITPRLREAEERVSLTAQADKIGEERKDSTETSSATTASAVIDTSAGVKVVTGTLTHSTKLQSDATEIEHNRAPQSSEWVDTITQRTDRTRTVQEQVAVELSVLNVDTQRPDTKAAQSLSERQEHPAEVQPDLNQGPVTASRTPTAASGVFASENQPTEADKELVDEMNSGRSSLSTKLSLKTTSPPKENESKNRIRKVFLVKEIDTTEVIEDGVDVSKTSTTVTESNGTDMGSGYKWKNRFEGVSQYRPYKTEFSSFTDSLSYKVSDTDTSPSSSSSALPEATAYKHLSNAYSSSSSSPPPDEDTTLGNKLSDRTTVYLRYEIEPAGAPKDDWRRSLVEQEEPAAPAAEREGQRERGAESERIKSRWDSQELPVSSLSSAQQTSYDVVDSSKKEEDDDSSRFTGVFKATLVELVSEPAAPPSTPPGSPDEDSPSQFDMDSLVDTLKSMGPSLRPRNIGPRAPAPVLISSLPPIVEDAPSPVTADTPGLLSPTKKMEAINNPAESLKGLYTLPADLGLKKTSNRDNRSPLELMKQTQQDLQQPGTRALNLPQRASVTNSLLLRKSSDSPPEELKSPVLNGNGLLPSPAAGSRLDNSVIFGGHRSASIDQPLENGKAHRSLFRTSSLPETGPLKDRMSVGPKELGEQSTGTEPAGSRFDRFSFLLNSPPSSGSLTGSDDSTRISRPPLLGIGSPPSSNSPTRLLSPTGSIDLQRPFTTTDSPLSVFGQTQGPGMGMGVGTGVLSTPILQRSFSNEGTAGVQQSPLFNSLHGVSPFQSQEVEVERNLVAKYRAFPDAYLTKEKEHGKLNPRPGKMYIFDRPGMCGQRIEIRSDVIDATPWELQETISIRVVRGGWVLYEKPNFKGEKIALDEGDIELTYPFNPPEEEVQNGQGGEKQNGEQNGEATDAQTETKPAKRFIIGSVRRAVRDYSVPEISLFPEENAEGKKVIFRDTSDDARIFGFPIKANSIIINAGLWLVYAHPFFQGVPRVLEVGGYSNPAAWGVEQPYVGSLHPLKVGEPRVENTSEPTMVIYDKPYFSGKSRTITTNMRDFITRVDRQQTAFMYTVGSLKVMGGIWVGYEKEGFRGHQYLLEEGEYQDWRVWGGRDAELRSARVIRADLTDPVMVMFEQPEEDQQGMQEENTFEVTEAIPDVELFGFKTSTRSIHVLSGAWIAYSHVDFSGDQYVLEKGFYNNCADWGSQDTRICSVQPILLAPGDNSRSRNEIILYSEPDFKGDCHVFDRNQEATPEKLKTKSCRVSGGSWVIYEDKQYSGNLYVLSEGDYPNLTSMGCPSDCNIRSVKVVPMKFSVPSISLFGLECLEGREITTDTEIPSMVEEGFNNHILSVRVNSGCWVICEHSNYRGRQFLLEPIEITNWPKFSSLQTIGSMFPVRQKRHYFRVKNIERGHFMSIQGGVEEMKSGRVVVTPEVEPMSDIWFYQDGFIKSKLAQNMSLQVMGNIEPGAKVVLWNETRQPIQTWAAKMSGLITSLTFPGCVLDVKGGKTYDKDHVVMMPESEERPSQQWKIELL